MSSNPNAGSNGRRPDTPDLSSTFGAAAASSLRGLLAGRRDAEEQTPEVDRSAAVVVDRPEQDPREESTRPAASHRSNCASHRRFRVARVRDRRHVAVLLLAAAREGPANGREFIELVRAASDGVFVLAMGTVYRTLHRLENEGLIRVTTQDGAHRYLLTPLGERVLSTRRGEWVAFAHGFDNVLDATDPRDGGTDPG